MKKRLLLRADGTPALGLGHVVRALALGEMLKDDFDITFCIREPGDKVLGMIRNALPQVIVLPASRGMHEEAADLSEKLLQRNDLMVCDGYNFDTGYQEIIKRSGTRLVCIDDIHAFHFKADIVINHAPGMDASLYSAEPYTKVLCGLDYAMLRPSFLRAVARSVEAAPVKNIFICVGGADPGNITRKLIEAALALERVQKIIAVTGPAYSYMTELDAYLDRAGGSRVEHYNSLQEEEMLEQMQRSHFAIVPASTISMELAALGIPMAAGYYVDNQLHIYEGLVKQQMIVPLGDLASSSVGLVSSALEKVIDDRELLEGIVSNQRKAIDGCSAERIKSAINAW